MNLILKWKHNKMIVTLTIIKILTENTKTNLKYEQKLSNLW